MNCKNCGVPLLPTDHFCKGCGTPVDAPAAPAPVEPATPAPNPDVIPAPVPVEPPKPDAPVPPAEPPKPEVGPAPAEPPKPDAPAPIAPEPPKPAAPADPFKPEGPAPAPAPTGGNNPKNDNTKYFIIGGAMIVCVIIVCCFVFLGNNKQQAQTKDDDKTEEVSGKDDNTGSQQEPLSQQYTTQVSYGGYVFSVPIDFTINEQPDGIALVNGDSTYAVQFMMTNLGYEASKARMNDLENYLGESATVGAPKKNKYSGQEFTSYEITVSSQKMLVALTANGSNNCFFIMIVTKDNSFGYEALEEISSIFTTAKKEDSASYLSGNRNMKIDGFFNTSD